MVKHLLELQLKYMSWLTLLSFS